MPRPRTPKAKAELTGQAAKHPDRFRHGARNEPELSGRPIGKPPKHLEADQYAVRAWGFFADELPWLVYEDRGILEVCAVMRGAMIRGDLAQPASFYATYRSSLQSLGASPVDRIRVCLAIPEGKDAGDPFAQFQKPN